VSSVLPSADEGKKARQHFLTWGFMCRGGRGPERYSRTGGVDDDWASIRLHNTRPFKRESIVDRSEGVFRLTSNRLYDKKRRKRTERLKKHKKKGGKGSSIKPRERRKARLAGPRAIKASLYHYIEDKT